MNVRRTVLTAEGAAGSATASGYINVNGKVYAIELNYTGLPATTDVVFADGTSEVLNRANSNTDETFYPRVAAAKADASASALTEVCPAVRKLTVELTGGDPDGTLEVVLYSE